jgi:hypothetical protein
MTNIALCLVLNIYGNLKEKQKHDKNQYLTEEI